MLGSLSSGETIISTGEKPVISEVEMQAYERRTDFHGFGEYLESLGEIRIIRGESC